MAKYQVAITGSSMSEIGASRRWVLEVEASAEEEALRIAFDQTKHFAIWNRRTEIVQPRAKRPQKGHHQ